MVENQTFEVQKTQKKLYYFLYSLFEDTYSHGKLLILGSSNLNQIINIITVAVHGGWTSWSAWSGCTKSCGGGTRMRSRWCSNPSPAHGGQSCAGGSLKSENCNVEECPG